MRVSYASYSGRPFYYMDRKVRQVYGLINTSSLLLVVLAMIYLPMAMFRNGD